MSYVYADFGKINLKNLQKVQDIVKGDKLRKAAQDFVETSKLKGSGTLADDVHDGIIHRKITTSLAKYLPNTTVKSKKDYLPLNLGKNPGEYNNAIEDVAVGIHGLPKDARLSSYPERHTIGRAVRKKKLTKVEKIMTADPENIELYKLAVLQNKPDKNTVKDYIQEMRSTKKEINNWQPSRFTPKTKGLKPTPTTIEEKQQKLKQKYGIL